jgi:hypothetical protein
MQEFKTILYVHEVVRAVISYLLVATSLLVAILIIALW